MIDPPERVADGFDVIPVSPEIYLGGGEVENPRLPRGLNAEASNLFRETVNQYGLDDAPSLVLLTNACLALMRLRKAEAIV